ncbi:MAG: hypothetical protein CL912_14820 [Deltaproteobacteria bacterium]|nr:hypothetical protein [Deltaproteobacteria bacterium]
MQILLSGYGFLLNTAHKADRSASVQSALGSSTTSIGSSILNYRKENGRRYHAYKDGRRDDTSKKEICLTLIQSICFQTMSKRATD